MAAQHAAQGLVKQVRGRVVPSDGTAPFVVHARLHRVAHRKAPREDLHLVDNQPPAADHCFGHFCLAAGRRDGAGVAHLSALLAVESRGVEDNLPLHPFLQGIRFLPVHHNGCDGAGRLGAFVPHKKSIPEALVQLAVYVARQGAPLLLAGSPGALLLGRHLPVEARLVNGEPVLVGDLHGQLQGEAVGIVEHKGHVAGKLGPSGAPQPGDFAVKQVRALFERPAEALLLHVDDLLHRQPVVDQLPVGVAHQADHVGKEIEQERTVNAEKAAEPGGPPKQPAEHVPPAVVGGQDAVGDHECHRTNMVRDHPDSKVRLRAVAVMDAAHGAGPLDHGHEQVGLEVGAHPLDDGRQPLESHSRVDVLLRQGHQCSVLLEVELGEHVVPDLQVPVTVAPHGALRPAAGELRPLVVHDLRTGTAGPLVPHEPEIVILAEAEDALVGNAHKLVPRVVGLIVVLVDGHRHAVRLETDHFRQEFPSPGDGLFLEIVPPGEVPQHLEKGMVPGRAAHVVDVVGSDALLGSHRPGRLGLLDAEVVGLEGHHSRNGEQQGRIVGNERKARKMPAPLGHPEINE